MDWLQRLATAVLMECTDFLSIAAVIVFLHCFYDDYFLWTGKKALFILGYALASAILLFCFGIQSVYLTIVGLVLPFIVLYDYRGKKIKGFLKFLVAYGIINVCMACISLNSYMLIMPESGIDALMAMENYVVPDSVTLFVAIMYALFLVPVFLYLYYRVYKRGVVVRCGKRELALAAIYPIVCFAVTIIIPFSSTVTLAILIGMSIILAFMFPVFMFYTRLSQHYRKMTEYQELYMQTELDHFMQYKQNQEETVRFRHDIRNNLLCVHEMLQMGKTKAAQNYLEELLDTTDTLRNKYVTGDEMLDCIIGVKAGIMAEKGIRFQLEGVLAGGLRWKVMDVCVVFANAFDNAMEACEQLPPEERIITLTIKSTPQFWLMTIQNPVRENIDINRLFRKNGGYTSKADATQHGIGTYNMKHVVESYGGILKATCQNALFTLEIMIDKSQ